MTLELHATPEEVMRAVDALREFGQARQVAERTLFGLALALESTKLDRRQREMIATLRECSTYLSSLVDDVLDFASIEAGRIEKIPDPSAPVRAPAKEAGSATENTEGTET